MAASLATYSANSDKLTIFHFKSDLNCTLIIVINT